MPTNEEVNLAKRLIDEFVKEGMEPSQAVLEIAMRTGALPVPLSAGCGKK